MRLFLFSLLLSLPLLAQGPQPQKESSSDLRSGAVMFKVIDLSRDNTFWLERTAAMDYYLYLQHDDDDVKIQKIDTRDAKRLEQDFASRFIKCQYEFPSSPENCKVTLRLSLKGEEQELCGKDERKSQELAPFMENLVKRF